MDQLEQMRSKIEALQVELSQSASQRRRLAIQSELNRQAPDAPDVIQRLAVAELGSSDDVAGEVKTFLASESVSGLINQPTQEKAVESKRPKLAEMLNEVKNGTAQFTMRH